MATRDSRSASIFLQRRSYRRRRVVDGLRMLPLLGAWLFLLPVLWPSSETAPATSSVLTYVFVSWAGLIALAGFLTWMQRRLGAVPDETEDDA